jgi:hypothetical protein
MPAARTSLTKFQTVSNRKDTHVLKLSASFIASCIYFLLTLSFLYNTEWCKTGKESEAVMVLYEHNLPIHKARRRAFADSRLLQRFIRVRQVARQCLDTATEHSKKCTCLPLVYPNLMWCTPRNPKHLSLTL